MQLTCSVCAEGLTPLQVAAESGDGEVCGLLLASGARAEITNSTGDTPLMVAALNNNFRTPSPSSDVFTAVSALLVRGDFGV